MKTRIVTLLVLVLVLGSSGVLAQPAAPAAPQADPAGLSFVGQFGGPIYRSTLVGTTLYLGGGTRLVVMDVSNPAAPTIVGQSADLGG
ncbi:MAG: hypothetical protein JXM73_04725, partial [Anaerolineae bacterium]|nr:hypothetical protein [Anaerolineae bacterium]